MSAECEICGKPDSSISAKIEGSVVNVCENCAKFGEILEIKKLDEEEDESFFKPKQKQQRKTISIEETTETVKSNLPELLKKARESKNMTQEDVANAISERLSFYQKIESGHIQTSIRTARKLERFFNIQLVESYVEPEKTKSINIDDKELTIGDLIKIKRKVS